MAEIESEDVTTLNIGLNEVVEGAPSDVFIKLEMNEEKGGTQWHANVDTTGHKLSGFDSGFISGKTPKEVESNDNEDVIKQIKNMQGSRIMKFLKGKDKKPPKEATDDFVKTSLGKWDQEGKYRTYDFDGNQISVGKTKKEALESVAKPDSQVVLAELRETRNSSAPIEVLGSVIQITRDFKYVPQEQISDFFEISDMIYKGFSPVDVGKKISALLRKTREIKLKAKTKHFTAAELKQKSDFLAKEIQKQKKT